MNVVASCVVARSKEVTCLSPLPSLARIYLPLDKQSEEGGRERVRFFFVIARIAAKTGWNEWRVDWMTKGRLAGRLRDGW